MIRGLAIAARFLLFHVLSAFTTVAALAIQSELMRAVTYDLPLDWVQLSQELIVVSLVGAFAAVVLLVPSALGWWAGGVWLTRRDVPLNRRFAGQGTIAGLTAFACLASILMWLSHLARQGQSAAQDRTALDDLIGLLPFLLGVPIGAFFGWLVYCRIWPNLPAPTLR